MARTKGDDGLIADDVGIWASEKHDYLVRYIDTARATRKKFLPPIGSGGSSYVDLFCGTGRSLVRETNQWIDGSAVAAWKASVEGGSPFSHVIISDQDEEALNACRDRLVRLGAPVTSYCLSALDAAISIGQTPSPHGLNLAFLDPYSIDLDFEVIRRLSLIKRMDLMIHVNQMDFQRNLKNYINTQDHRLSRFVPDWQSCLDSTGSQASLEKRFLEYWAGLVQKAGKKTATKWKLVTASNNQPLYYLLIAASHELAHKFWEDISSAGQKDLFG